MDAHREAHAQVMRRALGEAFVTNCTRSTNEAQRDCALDASDSKAAHACIATAISQNARRTK